MSISTANGNSSQATNQNSSLGKFKGVMLCNRPIAGPDEGSTVVKTELKAFKTGVVPEPLGINPILQYREIRKRPPLPAVVKHKQWLSELQKAREIILQEEEKERTRKIDRAKNYYKNENLLRKLAVETKETTENKIPEFSDTKKDDTQDISESKSETKYDQVNNNINKTESKFSSIDTKDKERPKWSYTADNYKKKEEENEEVEMDNLIDFVQNLNVENYLDDLEVRAALIKARNRIAELAEPKIRDEDKLQPGDLSKDNFFQENSDNNDTNNPNNDENIQYIDAGTDTDEEVDSVYCGSQAIREIHSRQSLKQKIKQMKDIKSSEEYTGPTIIENLEDGGARINKSSYPSNLPYLHRNPSV